jgi:TPR repeat protein
MTMGNSMDNKPKKLLTLAQRGDLYAQCCLADFYLKKENERGNRAAVVWLKRAASQGDY